ncbi:hypothetical protein Axi01nite_27380 [Actinoplanes xinjiangensis]|nr:hypothetical protein Axi01nite_27380 [Actinoplanes xinjiangensis]
MTDDDRETAPQQRLIINKQNLQRYGHRSHHRTPPAPGSAATALHHPAPPSPQPHPDNSRPPHPDHSPLPCWRRRHVKDPGWLSPLSQRP